VASVEATEGVGDKRRCDRDDDDTDKYAWNEKRRERTVKLQAGWIGGFAV
jgi:hypothetical protein